MKATPVRPQWPRQLPLIFLLSALFPSLTGPCAHASPLSWAFLQTCCVGAGLWTTTWVMLPRGSDCCDFISHQAVLCIPHSWPLGDVWWGREGCSGRSRERIETKPLAAQIGLEFLVLLPLPPKCDYRCVPPHRQRVLPVAIVMPSGGFLRWCIRPGERCELVVQNLLCWANEIIH